MSPQTPIQAMRSRLIMIMIVGMGFGVGGTLFTLSLFGWLLTFLPVGESDADVLACQECCVEQGYEASTIEAYDQCHCINEPGSRTDMQEECPL